MVNMNEVSSPLEC